MRLILSIFRLELKNLYYSPIPWVTVAIFSLHSGYLFTELLNESISNQELFGAGMPLTYNFFSSSQGIFNQLLNVLFLYVPLITMGKFSKEFSQGTYKLLFSSPIRLKSIVLGKFLSVLSFFCLLLLGLAPVLFIAVWKIPNIDIGLVLSGILGLLLLFILYAAVGLFVSATTRYSILSAVITLAILYLFRQIADIGKYSESFRDISYYFSITERTGNIIGGLLCSDDIAYFILLTLVFLFLAFSQLYFRQKQIKKYYQGVVYVVILIALVIVMKLLSYPYFIGCYDATANKKNTLSDESIAILNEIQGPVEITTYVNMADYLNWVAVPPSINADKNRFSKYLRFKPNIEMKYVYYEGEPLRNADYSSPYRLPTSSTARVFCEANKMDYNSLVPYWKLKEMKLQEEQNSVVRCLTTAEGTSVLRIYDDMMTHPSENEISLAFRALKHKHPQVRFVTSMTDRTLSTSQERGYGMVLSQKGNRLSLVNQGFDVLSLSLDTISSISEKNNILVVSDFGNKGHLEKYKTILSQYIQSGGNCLFLLGEENTFIQRELLHSIGVEIEMATILYPQQQIDVTIIPSFTTALLSDLSSSGVQGECVMLPSANNISYSLGGDFEAFPLLETEVHKCVAISSAAKNKDILSKLQQWQKYTPAMALERKGNHKLQRIVVVGDADFLSNQELNTQREGYNAKNAEFLLATMQWLSSGESPLDIKHTMSKDVFIRMTVAELDRLSSWIIYPLSVILLLVFGFLYLRRNRN